ncbi:hypothetical protein [Micromonospora sp. NPDC047074]|uniref:hypothetical protein n=1 Tax=Micromonospora sp. NPDC047074 TaxID=3154339 RepID=UPI00340F81CD
MSIIALALGMTLMTGCAIDKGTALETDFVDDWAGTPDVAKVETTGNNTLPFLGTATGTLIVKDGTSADRVAALANELRDYVARHGSTTGRIAADGITFTVVADKGRTSEAQTLWRSLTADARVVDGDIDDASRKETDRWRVQLTAADSRSAMAVFRDMLAAGDRHQPLSDVTHLEVDTKRDVRPALKVETDLDGGVPAEAIAAYEAVAAQYPIAGASLSAKRASIVVAGNADQDRAGELARRAAPNLGAVSVTSDRGN